MKCPACDQIVSKPARQGGIMIKARWVRVTVDGTVLYACAHCGSELERPTLHGRLVLYAKSSRSSA